MSQFSKRVELRIPILRQTNSFLWFDLQFRPSAVHLIGTPGLRWSLAIIAISTRFDAKIAGAKTIISSWSGCPTSYSGNSVCPEPPTGDLEFLPTTPISLFSLMRTRCFFVTLTRCYSNSHWRSRRCAVIWRMRHPRLGTIAPLHHPQTLSSGLGCSSAVQAHRNPVAGRCHVSLFQGC
jgi:hypothetical protein